MVIRLAHLGFRLTLLKTEAELGLVRRCQDMARDLGRAGCPSELGLEEAPKPGTGVWGPSARVVKSLPGDSVLSTSLLCDSVSQAVAERACSAGN